jgi:hypothetical protein
VDAGSNVHTLSPAMNDAKNKQPKAAKRNQPKKLA